MLLTLLLSLALCMGSSFVAWRGKPPVPARHARRILTPRAPRRRGRGGRAAPGLF